jgi:hypothetical protein
MQSVEINYSRIKDCTYHCCCHHLLCLLLSSLFYVGCYPNVAEHTMPSHEPIFFQPSSAQLTRQEKKGEAYNGMAFKATSTHGWQLIVVFALLCVHL